MAHYPLADEQKKGVNQILYVTLVRARQNPNDHYWLIHKQKFDYAEAATIYAGTVNLSDFVYLGGP